MTGEAEEKHWDSSHDGDDIKAAAVEGAQTTLAAKMIEAFKADGLFYKAMETVKDNLRGPKDFVERRRRPLYLKLQNGNESDDRESPLLAWIFALLLIILVSVGVVLHKLSNIEQGQDNHERRISSLERTTADGTPGEFARRDL
jgi:hypothetical protein